MKRIVLGKRKKDYANFPELLGIIASILVFFLIILLSIIYPSMIDASCSNCYPGSISNLFFWLILPALLGLIGGLMLRQKTILASLFMLIASPFYFLGMRIGTSGGNRMGGIIILVFFLSAAFSLAGGILGLLNYKKIKNK